ncbi:PRC-barrel domain-containing protein [Massilia sp. DWR3-1-1]|uniref:PRC-barrel domain-containing protein n=1 Tax=Massilia sp. DWR3-1-1 TaxID=2804559 RepID=UPI003CF8F671
MPPSFLCRPASTILACLGAALALALAPGVAHAQASRASTIVTMQLPSSATPVKGWSVQRGLLGRPIYDDGGEQIGTVIDLVVTSAAAPFVLIIGVGGHAEIGGHAVALPFAAVTDRKGLLHLPGASQASLKAMPRFSYDSAVIVRSR